MALDLVEATARVSGFELGGAASRIRLSVERKSARALFGEACSAASSPARRGALAAAFEAPRESRGPRLSALAAAEVSDWLISRYPKRGAAGLRAQAWGPATTTAACEAFCFLRARTLWSTF